MLETVYQGLARLPKLTSLSIRFPSSRHPRPTTVLPPMPHLRSLRITDIDPLCYPDDISTLLLYSKKLRELKMHWSPRMRAVQEASVSLHDYFRKCISTKTPLALKKVAFHNLYAFNQEGFKNAIDNTTIEDVTVYVNGDDESALSFVESSWSVPNMPYPKLKTVRNDRLDRRILEFLNGLPLENLYAVTPGLRENDLNAPRCPDTAQSFGPPPRYYSSQNGAVNGSPIGPYSSLPSTPMSSSNTSLRDSYLQMLTTVHGARLRHLLLPPYWHFSTNAIARLVRACPNIEQLAIATDLWSFETVGLLLPFLRKLVALRILIPTKCEFSSPNSRHGTPCPSSAQGDCSSGFDPSKNPSIAAMMAQLVDLNDRIHCETIGVHLADKDIFSNLKVIGFGWKAWELGDFYTVPASQAISVFQREDGCRCVIQGIADRINNSATPPTSHEPTSAGLNTNKPRLWSFTPNTNPKNQNGPSAQQANPSPFPNRIPTSLNDPFANDTLHHNSPINTAQGIDQQCTEFSALPTDSGVPLSDVVASAMFSKWPEERPVQPGEECLWRRRVKRASWDVLKRYEIWGLDVHEI